MADRALLVGINAYKDAPLSGCVNDVVDMASYLTQEAKFDPSGIRLLVDSRATKAAIEERLKWLVRGTKPGDRLVFHYSGHGTQVADRNGGDEIDRLDEVICPVNFDWTEPHLIRDDFFADLFKSVPAGVKFAWIADCCHSGTLTRDFFAPRASTKKTKSKKSAVVLGARFLTPPADHLWRVHVARGMEMAAGKIQKTIAASAKLNVQFVSGCRDNQTSADASFGNRPNGALTYYLLKSLRAKKGAPFSSIVTTTRTSLARAGFDQVPQSDGNLLERPFLG